ncbi:MAG: hypothetical protein AAGG44_16435 [Planctomycetota bacterium]
MTALWNGLTAYLVDLGQEVGFMHAGGRGDLTFFVRKTQPGCGCGSPQYAFLKDTEMSPQRSSQKQTAQQSGNGKTDALTSFGSLTDEQLEAHLEVASYGAFELTDAIRPSVDLKVIPKQGFRHETYVDPTTEAKVPVIMAAATKHRLFDLFIDMIDTLGPVVDVVLETSHYHTGGHEDYYREHMDMPVLKSILYDYEDMLLNDGCTGIAVLNPQRQQEVQFDEHKMVIAYGSPLESFERVLISNDVYIDEEMRFITEAEHVHTSSDQLFEQFQSLAMRLGMESESDQEDDAEYC